MRVDLSRHLPPSIFHLHLHEKFLASQRFESYASTMNLEHNTYGKADVQVLKVFRQGERHSVRELSVSVRVEGSAFAMNYTASDNASCVPTDTIKNNVYATAAEHLKDEAIELFAERLADNYLRRYSVIEKVTVSIDETAWNRVNNHEHSFQQAGGGRHYCVVEADRDGMEVSSGLTGLTVLKTSGSGFAGFHECDRTVLQPTDDRLMATTVTADWAFAGGGSYESARAKVVDCFLTVFSEEFSPSVQRTLFRVGEEVLGAVPEIAAITMSLPNEHYFPVDLERIGGKSNGTLFYPSKSPFGDIEATVTR